MADERLAFSVLENKEVEEMRHRVAGRRLGRTSEHRLAMRRNIVASLFEHETISTTIEKAKEVKPFAEKLITLAKQGTLAARRRAISQLGNRAIVELVDGDPVKKGTVIGKLFSELGPRYLDRPGGYTRIVRLSLRRLGDNGQLVLLQLIGADESPKKKAKSSKRRSKAKAESAPSEEVKDVAVEVVEPAETEGAAEETQVEDQATEVVAEDGGAEQQDDVNSKDKAGEQDEPKQD